METKLLTKKEAQDSLIVIVKEFNKAHGCIACYPDDIQKATTTLDNYIIQQEKLLNLYRKKDKIVKEIYESVNKTVTENLLKILDETKKEIKAMEDLWEIKSKK